MKQLLIVRRDLINLYGYPRMMVQAADASTKLITNMIIDDLTKSTSKKINTPKEMDERINGIHEKILLYVKSQDKLLEIYNDAKQNNFSILIKDNSLTISSEETYTCIAIMGDDKDMDIICKKYKLKLLK